ncbi:MAG: hypothetical protein ABSC90_08425 [Acidimicrobiales bacterium]
MPRCSGGWLYYQAGGAPGYGRDRCDPVVGERASKRCAITGGGHMAEEKG